MVYGATPRLRFPLSVSLQNFDPTEAEDFITIRILMNLGQGLVMFDKNLKPHNALCESYKISPDQTTYTFKLKKSQWSDGKNITSADFIRGFERTLSPSTAAKISQNLQDLIVNARDYKNKKITDFKLVGIKALDEKTLEFKLNHPAAYFLSLLSLPFSYPQRDSGGFLIKENTPTSGAYYISELKDQSKILLKPNPHFTPLAQNEVELKIITDSATLVNLFEKNEIDVLEKVPSHDFDRLKNSKEMHSAPFLATYYFGFNITKKPFDSLDVRKTVALAIKREEVGKILRDPQIISSSWVPTPLPTSNHEFKIILS
jgi:oligopeptide transport system substrate-binding protein